MAMIQRLRARFRVPAELLLPPPNAPGRRSGKRAPGEAVEILESNDEKE
jgi:hypothetical protein